MPIWEYVKRFCDQPTDREVYLFNITMENEIALLTEAHHVSVREAAKPATDWVRWFELFLVLLVSFGNFILSSLSLLAGGASQAFSSPNIKWAAPFIQEATALLVLAYVMRRRGLRIRDLGLRWSLRAMGIGLVLTGVAYTAYICGYSALSLLHRLLFASATRGTSAGEIFGYPSLLMVAFVLLNPFFEELIVRAYLMTEIKALTGSWTLSVVLSVLVQTAYHLYYGWTIALALGCQFLVFSIFYAKTRKATPLVVAHGLFDWIGVLRLF